MPLPQAPALTLVKEGTLDMTVVAPLNRADVGDKVNYTLTATNTGNVTLTGVTVSDPKLGALVCVPPQPATLAPGAQIVCTGSYTLTQADLNAGQVANTATTDSAQTPPTTGDGDGAAAAGAGAGARQGGHARPDRGRADQPRRRRRQGQLHAHRDERRQRDADGRDGRRSEAGDARLHAAAAGDAGAEREARLHGQLHADAGRPQRRRRGNTATGDSDQTPPTTATETVPLPQSPALTVVKQGVLDMTVVAPDDRPDVGDKVDYTLTAANVGNVTLTGVTVSDPKLGTLVCVPPQPATLAPGAQIVCTGTYTLTQADLNAGQVSNTATADSDQTPPAQTTVTVPLPQASDLTLGKSGTLVMTVVAPANRADVGDRVDYTLTATNTGNVTLTGVTVTDPKLGALVCTPPQPATLAPGAQIVCTGSYTLTQADVNNGQVTNTATTDSDQTPPDDGRRHRAAAAGAGPDPRQAGRARHDRGRAGEPGRRGRPGELHADGGERRQRDADGCDDRRSEAGDARVHAAAAGDAGAGRDSSSARAATR